MVMYMWVFLRLRQGWVICIWFSFVMVWWKQGWCVQWVVLVCLSGLKCRLCWVSWGCVGVMGGQMLVFCLFSRQYSCILGSVSSVVQVWCKGWFWCSVGKVFLRVVLQGVMCWVWVIWFLVWCVLSCVQMFLILGEIWLVFSSIGVGWLKVKFCIRFMLVFSVSKFLLWVFMFFSSISVLYLCSSEIICVIIWVICGDVIVW